MPWSAFLNNIKSRWRHWFYDDTQISLLQVTDSVERRKNYN